MFGLFKKAPVVPLATVLDELGKMSNQIMRAITESDYVSVAVRGASSVTSIISACNSHFGLKVQPGTIFASFAGAVQRQDFEKILDMTRHMADVLSQISDPNLRGRVLLHWFTGEE